MPRALRRQHLKFVAAAALASLGLAAAWRVIAPAPPHNPAGSSSAGQPQPATFFYQAPADFPDLVNPQNVRSRAEEVAKLATRSDALVKLSASDRYAIGEAVAEEFAIVLSGSFDGHLARLRATGANSPLLHEGVDEARREAIESLWKERAGVVAFRPVSIRETIVRPRFIRGAEIPQPPLGQMAIYSAPSRYGLGSTDTDAEKAKLTVYEVIMPVQYNYEYRKISGPVWWGFWLARDERNPARWLPWRSVVYDPLGVGASVCPGF